MAWAYVSYVGGRLLVLASTAVLARLLVPHDFGLVALALVAMTLLEAISDLGVTQALVVVPEEEVADQAETVFVVSVSLGAALSAVTAALGPLAAKVFHEPRLTTLVGVLGLNLFLRSLGDTHYALAQKRLDFRTRAFGEAADVVVRGTLGIVLALAGLGAWSLVLGYLAGTLALDAVMWLRVPWRPRLRPRRAHLRRLIGFGGTLTAVDVIAAVIANVDDVAVGRVLGAAALGLYALAFRLPELLIINLAIVAGQVLYPAFAAVRPGDVRHVFLVSLRYTLVIVLPAAVLLALLAEPLVVVLFGEKWRGAAPAMQALAVYAAAVAIGIPGGIVYKATGRAGVLLALAVPRALLVIIALVLFTSRGIVAVGLSQAAVAVLFTVIASALASRLLAVSGRTLWSVAAPPVIAAGVLAAVVLGAGRLAPGNAGELAAGVVGVVAYAAALRLIAPQLVRDLLAQLRPASKRKPRRASVPLRVGVAVAAGGAVVALVTMAMLAVEPKLGIAAIGGLVAVPLALTSLSAAIAMLVAVQFLAALPAFGIAATSLLALTVVRWVAWPAARERIRARRWPARWPLWIAALVLWLALSVLWARRPDVSLGALPAWALSALLAVVVATGVGTRRDVVQVMRGFVWGATVSVAIGLVATIWAHGGSLYADTFFEDRLQGGARDPNFLAAGVVAAIALAGGLMANDRGWRRVADVGAIAVLVLGLAATQSRGGAIAAAVAALVAVALSPGRRWRMTFGVTALAAMVVAGLALSPGGLARLSTADREGSGRRDLWIVATRVAEARPLTGVGLDNFRTVSPDYVREPGTLTFVDLIAEQPHEAHDTYLQALADTGIVGLTLFVGAVLASLGALARAVRRGIPFARPVLIAAFGMLAALVFLSDGSDPLLWTLFGLGPALLAMERAHRRR